MARDLVIGLDAGTSVIKAVAFDISGREVFSTQHPNRVLYRAGGAVEQDLEETWQAALATLLQLGEQVPNLAARTAAVAVTGQGDGTWLIDEAGEPVGPALLWLDARASGLVEQWRNSDVGRRVFEITGTGINPANQSGQLGWLQANQPERLARAARAFHCKDWLYYRMTGEPVTDVSEALFTFGDYRTGDYSPAVLEALDLTQCRRLLPEIIDGTWHMGRLNETAANACGLSADTPVVLAPVDILCSAAGAGAYEPGRNVGCTVLGSTGVHLRLRHGRMPETDLDQVGYTMVFPAPATWAHAMLNMAATLNIDWLLQLVSELADTLQLPLGSTRDVRRALDAKVRDSRPGRVLFHPYIAPAGERGPFVNPWARAQFLGLRTSTRFADMLRAVYEGIAFAARDCYEALGRDMEEIRLAGGAAGSDHCREIFAAAVGVPVRRSERRETGAAGAALFATVALGHYASVDAACREWVTPFLRELEAPNPDLQAVYDRLFPAYRQGYQGSEALWQSLREFDSTGAQQ